MDMDVDNMDTAFLKSWSEVLRRTDPLLWSLALETSSAAPSSSSLSLAAPVHTNRVHNCNNTCPSDPDHPLSLSQAPLFSQSSSSTLQAKESSSSKLAPQTHRKQSFCRSLLNPHDAHALDWLKCLILTEDYNVLVSGKKNHQVLSSENNRPLGANQTQDFGPVGQVISRRKGAKHANSGAPISSSGSSASGGSGNTPSSAASTTSTSTATATTAAASSTATTSWGAFAGAVHVGIGAGYRPRQQMTGSGTMDSAVSDSAATSPLTPSPVHASDAVAATAAVSDATHSRESSLTNVNPATPPPHQPATVVPISGSVSISSNASVNSTTTSSSTSTAAAATEATASTTPSLISSTGPPSSSSAATTTGTSPTSHTSPSRKLPFLPVLKTPIVLPSLETVVPMAQKQLVRSKDATVAFFYRTFSPTYRICQLYINSWSNGSQKRGLERIQRAFVEVHAFTVVKVATSNMKDIWHQVLAAYKIKSANAKAEKARRLAKSAKGKK